MGKKVTEIKYKTETSQYVFILMLFQLLKNISSNQSINRSTTKYSNNMTNERNRIKNRLQCARILGRGYTCL
jgi:hypothetical protein